MTAASSPSPSLAERRHALLVTCHPGAGSLCASLAETVVEAYRARGAALVVEDLAAAGFDPVLTRAELSRYFDRELPNDVEPLTRRLLQARELIFILPVWMYGMPALLKGYFDRVWRPEVSFRLRDDGELVQLLVGIERVTVIATHGRGRAETDLIGDGTLLFFERSLPSALPGLKSNVRFDFYALDTADPHAIEREFAAVRAHFANPF